MVDWGENQAEDEPHPNGNGEDGVIHSRDVGSGNGIIPDVSYGERLKDILDSDEDEGDETELGMQIHEGLNDELDPNDEGDEDDQEDGFGSFRGFRVSCCWFFSSSVRKNLFDEGNSQDDNSDKSPSTTSMTSTKFRNLNANAHESAPSPSRRSPFLRMSFLISPSSHAPAYPDIISIQPQPPTYRD